MCGCVALRVLCCFHLSLFVLFMCCVLLFSDGSGCLFDVIRVFCVVFCCSKIALAIRVLFGQRPGSGFTVVDLGLGLMACSMTSGDPFLVSLLSFFSFLILLNLNS